ncbi:hypothetical protein BCU68_12535 [Vibrio sp. 10N.286.49.B3]|uniref:hypothetical protein n=1 Tax=Vibrio sp. 10N.286.49.B3 TaxID=1880855 RepID=UPI000C853B57|nr:hypothetical protein [Vibrio sp. 10N.286.49.B3]PMH44666.1 hypothetical protein BCU68_12535 [Vibrio sp. 10N.286.49.B3]
MSELVPYPCSYRGRDIKVASITGRLESIKIDSMTITTTRNDRSSSQRTSCTTELEILSDSGERSYFTLAGEHSFKKNDLFTIHFVYCKRDDCYYGQYITIHNQKHTRGRSLRLVGGDIALGYGKIRKAWGGFVDFCALILSPVLSLLAVSYVVQPTTDSGTMVLLWVLFFFPIAFANIWVASFLGGCVKKGDAVSKAIYLRAKERGLEIIEGKRTEALENERPEMTTLQTQD